MDNDLSARVHAAAVAGWWTFLVALVFFMTQWLGYLLIMHARPAWALPLWGPGATWDSIRSVWFLGLAFLKLSLWPLALTALWLTLWARRLRRNAPSS